MLIVCPSCATSYMIDPAALGSGGRTVRCARCKATWFAGWQKPAPDVNVFIDGVIAEAEAQSASGAPERSTDIASPPVSTPVAADDFGVEGVEPVSGSISEPPPPEIEVHSEAVAPEPAQAPPEPFAVQDAPSLVPPIEHDQSDPVDTDTEPSEDAEGYATRRQRMHMRRKQARRSSRWTAIVLVLFAINVALIGARNDVVRYLPQTASLFAAIGLPVNLRHLKFENVRISKELQDGVNILVVEGTIASTSDKPVTVPRLRFAARNAAGQEIYVWTALPSRSILGPGEHLDFHSRLASPPADATSVMVRFFTAQDAAAEAR